MFIFNAIDLYIYVLSSTKLGRGTCTRFILHVMLDIEAILILVCTEHHPPLTTSFKHVKMR